MAADGEEGLDVVKSDTPGINVLAYSLACDLATSPETRPNLVV